ncbi:hypothetical protein KP509_16G024700 [Ceratopteris richardii]|uniref:Uncharacterized protein n=1 Tax=Ceratopteris richardii TaxID=49495 RepID=A0A8T2T0Y0_CERRI|nr:hypothetical protein KP509_16G024700 [Ceratopteris richardii]KAH7387477.1 hypothetical protein KP509_16G024700 [Ceratopteris richardii]
MAHGQNGTLVTTSSPANNSNAAALYQDPKSGRVSPNNSSPLAGHKLNIATGVVSTTNNSHNEKAEVFAEAHRYRVETEAHSYREAESRKVEARAKGNLAKAERQRILEEAKALEAKQREEQRAELVIRNAKAKAERVIALAHARANRINSKAQEEAEKAIADAYTKAERLKAEVEETKKREFAEIADRVQHLITVGELPAIEYKGVVQRMKASFVCHS